jgi:hypothetical protein
MIGSEKEVQVLTIFTSLSIVCSNLDNVELKTVTSKFFYPCVLYLLTQLIYYLNQQKWFNLFIFDSFTLLVISFHLLFNYLNYSVILFDYFFILSLNLYYLKYLFFYLNGNDPGFWEILFSVLVEPLLTFLLATCISLIETFIFSYYINTTNLYMLLIRISFYLYSSYVSRQEFSFSLGCIKLCFIMSGEFVKYLHKRVISIFSIEAFN